MEDLIQIEHFNKESLLEKISGKEKTFLRLIETSKTVFPDYFLAVKKAIDSSDFNQVADLAHTIKGAAGTMCFNRLEKTAFELEKMTPDATLMIDLLEKMKAEFEIIRKLMD
jgi:HPt (histidine-containing phosphotransfer) domain-containing protein